MSSSQGYTYPIGSYRVHKRRKICLRRNYTESLRSSKRHISFSSMVPYQGRNKSTAPLSCETERKQCYQQYCEGYTETLRLLLTTTGRGCCPSVHTPTASSHANQLDDSERTTSRDCFRSSPYGLSASTRSGGAVVPARSGCSGGTDGTTNDVVQIER